MPSSTYFLTTDGSERLVQFDAVTGEIHELTSRISDHPVERGLPVTDHVQVEPITVNIIGIKSNQPIDPDPLKGRGQVRQVDVSLVGLPPIQVQTLVFDEEFDAIRETWDLLTELQEEGAILEVATPLRTYSDMIIQRTSAPRTAGREAVAFSIDLRRLLVVSTGTVAAPPVPTIPAGVKKVSKGSQGPKKPTEEKKAGSIAFRVLKSQGLL